MCDYSFTYSYTTTFDLPGDTPSHRLVFTISAAAGPDGWNTKDIFLYQRELKNPDSGLYASFFTAVCTPSDLSIVTETAEPSTSSATPTKFRLDYVALDFRSRTELEQCLADIIADITGLSLALRRNCEAEVGPVTGTILA